MAVISTSGSETIAQWLADFNSLSTVVGDAATLTTDVTTNLVAAINSVKTNIDTLDLSEYLKNDTAFTKTAGNVTFNDNVQAIFGTGSDLKIYHDGSNSIIGASNTHSIFLKNLTNNENYIQASPNGAVYLFHDGSGKLYTTVSGVNITGNLTASGNVSGVNLTASGDAIVTGVLTSNNNTQSMIVYGGTSGNGANIELYGGSHSTLANDINYDADQHNFRTQAGTATFTIDASGNVTAAGNITTSAGGAIIVSSGSAATPAVRSSSDTNTGAYWDGADAFAVSAGGAQVIRFDTRGTEFTGAIQEDVYSTNITGSVALTPANGTIWHVSLTGTVTFTDSLVNGDSMILNIAGSTLYDVIWPASNWTWVGTGGSAPTLETSGRNVVSLVKSGGVVYASYAGGTV